MTTQTSVPLLDLKLQYDQLREEVEPVLREVCDSQYFVLGPKVVELENKIAAYVGTNRAVGCASGSDALLLALMALDIKVGDEVICPSYTFFATGGAIHRLGAIPVWADIDPVTYNMTPENVREASEGCSNLKAIMPVHLYGQTVDMDGMLEVGQTLGVPIIEYAAQAIGSKDKKQELKCVWCSLAARPNLSTFSSVRRVRRSLAGRHTWHNKLIGLFFRTPPRTSLLPKCPPRSRPRTW